MAGTQIRVVVAARERFLENVMKALVLDIVANLKAAPSEGGTPRLTGFAATNWVPRIGTAFEGLAGSPGAVSTSDQSTGIAVVATSYKLQQGPIHITNNTAYILKLNEGSSAQAPPGFIQAGIKKAIVVDLPRKFGR